MRKSFRYSKHGFTLIELVFVMLLIMLFIGIAVPKFNEMSSVNLRSAARQLSAIVRYSFDQSVLKGVTYRVVLDLDNGSYWLEEEVPPEPPLSEEGEDDAGFGFDDDDSDEDDEIVQPQFVRISKTLARPKKLPAGIRIREFRSIHSKERVKEGYSYLYFYPEGETTGGELVLENRDENSIMLKINPYTGLIDTVPGGKIDDEAA